MTDIVEQLRDAERDSLAPSNRKFYGNCANEIEALRQQVKALLNTAECRRIDIADRDKRIHQLYTQLAALKQGQSQSEPVAIINNTSLGFMRWLCNELPPHGTKLYTSAPTIPAGYVLVPVEPTEEMILAGDAFMECASSLGEAWEAMIAAAPKHTKNEDQPQGATP